MAKYGDKASEKVEKAMHELKKGTLKSGSSRKKPEAGNCYWTLTGSEGRGQGAAEEILKEKVSPHGWLTFVSLQWKTGAALVNSLRTYQQKRRFDQTPEPKPKPEKKQVKSKRRFVVQKHRARNLHYDFRLEADGVLKSWAVPKGLSPNPGVKRLAMAVEDHPLDYANFEGVIPEGQYGGGTVMVWDRGTYEPENGEQIGTLIKRGEVKLKLKGKKLKGSWVLVRTRDRNWLLIKHRDQYASENELTETSPKSVLTQRTLAEIASQEGGNVEKAASGDPRSLPRLKKTLRRK